MQRDGALLTLPSVQKHISEHFFKQHCILCEKRLLSYFFIVQLMHTNYYKIE